MTVYGLLPGCNESPMTLLLALYVQGFFNALIGTGAAVLILQIWICSFAGRPPKSSLRINRLVPYYANRTTRLSPSRPLYPWLNLLRSLLLHTSTLLVTAALWQL